MKCVAGDTAEPLTRLPSVRISRREIVKRPDASIQFEQDGTLLKAVAIRRRGRAPVIGVVQRTLWALGVVVAMYQVRSAGDGLVERMVLERQDGGAIEGSLSAQARAAILPLALELSE
jgi:hypothetical protein